MTKMALFSQISQITEHLFLSSASAAQIDTIRFRGITQVINCTMEIPNLEIDDVKCVKITVDDNPKANLAANFDSIADMIDSEKQRGGYTLVHCVAGVSRSAALCIAYLMKYHQVNLKDAFKKVKTKRFVIRPNVGFFKQLIEYEEKLYGKTTVSMVTSPIGFIPDVYEADTKHMVWLPNNPDKLEEN